jgi:isocitrate dehydrogenase
VQQFVEEGHLRWDSLGEYCALVPAFEQAAAATDNAQISVLAETLDAAIGQYLANGRNPSRKVNELDNRGATYYLTLYWAEALAKQSKDASMQERFTPVAQALAEHEQTILEELLAAQGSAIDLGGYYHPNAELLASAMRPSATLNKILQF